MSIVKNRAHERGNVLFFILIGVVLFGALSFTVGEMLRGGSEQQIGEERAGILADEILNYGRNMRETVQALRISNGCAPEDISFENNVVSGFEHSPVADDECKVFHPDGGGLSYIAPASGWLDASQSGNTQYGEYVFAGKPPVIGIGTDTGSDETDVDLVLFLNYVDRAICLQINEKSDITNTGDAPPVDAGAIDTFTKFTDTFLSGSSLNATETDGKSFGCFQDNGQTRDIFYQVLIAR